MLEEARDCSAVGSNHLELAANMVCQCFKNTNYITTLVGL